MGRSNKKIVPISEKIALTPAEVAALTGICESLVRRHIKSGELPAKRLGRCVYVLRRECDLFVEKLQNFEGGNGRA